jgi:hypothetical protein
MERALFLLLLTTGCVSSIRTYRADTNFAKSTTTVCLYYKGSGDAGAYEAQSRLDAAIAHACIEGSGPVANGAVMKGKDADGGEITCIPIRCQATLLTGQSTPAKE